MAVVHLVPGPTVEVRRRPDRERWCFGCRARLPHDVVVYNYEDPTSTYFDPVAVLECSGCGRDKTAFGSTRR